MKTADEMADAYIAKVLGMQNKHYTEIGAVLAIEYNDPDTQRVHALTGFHEACTMIYGDDFQRAVVKRIRLFLPRA